MEDMKIYNALVAAKLAGTSGGGGGNIASSNVTAMTGYSKAQTAADISTSDTLNTAMGKLEKGVSDNSSLISQINNILNSIADVKDSSISTWTLGKSIASDTGVVDADYAAVTDVITVGNLRKISADLFEYEGYSISLNIVEYNENNNVIGSRQKLNGETITFNSSTAKYKLCFQLPSTSGITMTQDIIDDNFRVILLRG